MKTPTSRSAVLAAALVLLHALPVAAAAGAGPHVVSSGWLPLEAPVASSGYEYRSSCPLGNPGFRCGYFPAAPGLGYVEFRFNVVGSAPGVGVDRVFLEGSGIASDGTCRFTLRAPDGSTHDIYRNGCQLYTGWVKLLPAGTYTLRIECHCNSAASIFDTEWRADHAGYSAELSWETSHAVAPPRADAAIPRVCFQFHLDVMYETWRPRFDLHVDFGDGETFDWTGHMWNDHSVSFCHVYDVPVGTATVCMSVDDEIRAPINECQLVDRGVTLVEA